MDDFVEALALVMAAVKWAQDHRLAFLGWQQTGQNPHANSQVAAVAMVGPWDWRLPAEPRPDLESVLQ